MCKSLIFNEFNALLLPYIYNNTAKKEYLIGVI